MVREPKPVYETADRILNALLEDSRTFCVLRAILGVTPPEWAELARFEHFDDIPQNAARTLDRKCREDPGYVRRLEERYRARLVKHNKCGSPPPDRSISLKRIDALIQTAISCISQGAPKEVEGVIHRMAKFDTLDGINPAVIIEAKITSDDGTARDKVARIKELETQRNRHVAEGRPHYDVSLFVL